MIVFPQLKTGAMGQYPLVRRRKYSAVTNILNDGTMLSYSDSTPKVNRWDLTLRDLTDAEADVLVQLFQTVEGRRGTFTFIDPTANLLAHSEELDSSCWMKAPLLQVSGGVGDPLGGTRGIRLINGGQTTQALSQTLTAPAWFNYCFSVYACSAAGSALSLTRSSSSTTHTRLFQLGTSWTQCVLSGALNGADESLQFTLELPAGASVDVFGIQAEAQLSASAYKRSGDRNGVYSSARFNDDVLQQMSEGPDQHRFEVKIVAKD